MAPKQLSDSGDSTFQPRGRTGMNLNLAFVFESSSFNIIVCLSLFICFFAKNLSGSAEVEEARGKLKVSSKFVQDVADYVRLVTMIMIIIYIMR